jgi:hypothetical protein
MMTNEIVDLPYHLSLSNLSLGHLPYHLLCNLSLYNLSLGHLPYHLSLNNLSLDHLPYHLLCKPLALLLTPSIGKEVKLIDER